MPRSWTPESEPQKWGIISEKEDTNCECLITCLHYTIIFFYYMSRRSLPNVCICLHYHRVFHGSPYLKLTACRTPYAMQWMFIVVCPIKSLCRRYVTFFRFIYSTSFVKCIHACHGTFENHIIIIVVDVWLQSFTIFWTPSVSTVIGPLYTISHRRPTDLWVIFRCPVIARVVIPVSRNYFSFYNSV